MIDLTDNDGRSEKTSKARELPQTRMSLWGNERENRLGGFPRFLSLLTFQCFVVGKRWPSCGLAFRKRESSSGRAPPFL